MAAKKRPLDSNNPFTGQPANTYTQVTNRELPRPVAARDPDFSSRYKQYLKQKHSARRQDFETAREEGGGGFRDLGYQAPAGMEPHHFAFLTGQLAAMPNAQRGLTERPEAINEPHEISRHAVLSRRGEDLSGPEARKGLAALAQFGMTLDQHRQDIGDALDSAHRQSIDAYAAPHETAGSGFYGGPSEPREVMSGLAEQIQGHPNFRGRGDAAWAMTAAANSATSPNNPFEVLRKDGERTYPNNRSASASVMHALDGKGLNDKVEGGGGAYPANLTKAVHMSQQINGGRAIPELQTQPAADGSTEPYFDWTSSPKTSSYVSAHIEASSPDSARVSDVHSTRSGAQHLDFAKSRVFEVRDGRGRPVLNAAGKPLSHTIEDDDVDHETGVPHQHVLALLGLKGKQTLVRKMKKGKPVDANSPVEEMLSKGGHALHAISDMAAREAYAGRGLIPSKNHAQMQNQGQELDWRAEQMRRPDLPYSTETEYPSHSAVTEQHDVLGMLRNGVPTPNGLPRRG